ncbi:unnamed protein product [Brassica oleracea]
MKIPRNISSKLLRIGPSEIPSKYPEEVLPRYIPRSFPTNWWSSEFPQKFISSEFRRKIPRDFRGKMNFRGLVLSVCRRNNVIPTTYRRFFPSVCRCFLVVGACSKYLQNAPKSSLISKTFLIL